VTATAESIAAAYAAYARMELGKLHDHIRYCVGQLSEAQIWWRPHPAMNSVGNLILHLAGNVGQWIVSGVGGAPDTRDRPAEFAERGPIPKAELLRRLADTVAAADKAVAGIKPDTALDPRRIQGHDETPLTASFHSIAHFHGHTQEIIHMTREQLGDAYKFKGITASQAQAAPA
jgi:Protein of unknown function (DUF1572)